jgi:hypothetical protein
MIKTFFSILFVGIVGVVLAGVFLVAASGLYTIPWLTKALGADKPRDFGIVASEKLFTDQLTEQQITLTSPYEQYCLTCNLVYSEPAPMNITLDSEALTSYLQITNQTLGPLKNIQIKLGDDNFAETSAWIDLTPYGYDLKGPVYMAGSFTVVSPQSIYLDIETAKVGMLPVPTEYMVKAETELNKLVDTQLDKMTGLKIDTLEVSAGTLLFQGDFPHTISASAK